MVNLSGVTQITAVGTGSTVRISSNGLGSNINLSSLQNLAVVEGSSISSEDGGTVQVPQLQTLSGVSLEISSTGGQIDTAQITSLRFGSITLNGKNADLNGLNNIEGTSLFVSGGINQSIPAAITNYRPNGNTFEANGLGSQLTFSGLTSINNPEGSFRSLDIRARNGGVVNLSGVTQITAVGTGSTVVLSSTGAGSLIDLPSLTTLNTVPGSRIEVSSSGTVRAPNLSNLVNVDIVNNGGTIIIP